MNLRQSTHERAVEVIQAAGNPVCLLVQSLVHLVRFNGIQEYRRFPPRPRFSIDLVSWPTRDMPGYIRPVAPVYTCCRGN